MFRRIDTVIVRVRDLQQAAAWYRRVLQLSTAYEDAAERLVVLATPEGGTLTLWELKAGETPAAGSAATTYPIFAVDDAAAAHHQLQELGVELEPLSRGEGVHFFGFRDPDGNRLEACQVVP